MAERDTAVSVPYQMAPLLSGNRGAVTPVWTPAWAIVSARTVESYTSIPPHLHSKSLPRGLLTFGGIVPPGCLYKRWACSPKLGRKRERWATQLSRTPSKASDRDAEQHSTSIISIRDARIVDKVIFIFTYIRRI
jgi:hypothetical protein